MMEVFSISPMNVGSQLVEEEIFLAFILTLRNLKTDRCLTICMANHLRINHDMAYNINNGIKPTMNVDHVPNEKPTRFIRFSIAKNYQRATHGI
jgi:hypothetical protein